MYSKNPTFLAHSDHILGQLPEFVREQIPVYFTAINAVHRPLVESIQRGMINGQSAGDMRDMISEFNAENRDRAMKTYYAWAKYSRERRIKRDAENHEKYPHKDLPPDPVVKEFEKEKFLTGFLSVAYIIFVYLSFTDQFMVLFLIFDLFIDCIKPI